MPVVLQLMARLDQEGCGVKGKLWFSVVETGNYLTIDCMFAL
jgi:hypothetical protein